MRLVGTDFSESKCEMLCNELAHARFKALQIIRRRGIARGEGKIVVKATLNHWTNTELHPRVLLLDCYGQQVRQ